MLFRKFGLRQAVEGYTSLRGTQERLSWFGIQWTFVLLLDQSNEPRHSPRRMVNTINRQKSARVVGRSAKGSRRGSMWIYTEGIE